MCLLLEVQTLCNWLSDNCFQVKLKLYGLQCPNQWCGLSQYRDTEIAPELQKEENILRLQACYRLNRRCNVDSIAVLQACYRTWRKCNTISTTILNDLNIHPSAIICNKTIRSHILLRLTGEAPYVQFSFFQKYGIFPQEKISSAIVGPIALTIYLK